MSNLKLAFALAGLIYVFQVMPDMAIGQVLAGKLTALYAPIKQITR